MVHLSFLRLLYNAKVAASSVRQSFNRESSKELINYVEVTFCGESVQERSGRELAFTEELSVEFRRREKNGKQNKE